jgi:hypothetical protein
MSKPVRVCRPIVLILGMLFWGVADDLAAHCDTLDGPVVAAARVALAKGDVTPALAWVRPEQEREVRELFDQALRVRRQGPEAREMADRYFFETLVRLHRMSEGAPYTGLHSGTPLDPVVAWTDEALEVGTPDGVIRLLTGQITAGVRRRFFEAFEAKKRAADSVEAGRAYVASYVEYTHFVERLYRDAVHAPVPPAPDAVKREPEHTH